MIFLIQIIAWCYSSLEGTVQGFYYNNPDNTKSNIHFLFTINRVLVLILLYMLTNLESALSAMYAFSFFHNGMYYWTRNILDYTIYHKKFMDTSTTSKASIEFDFFERTVLYAMSIGFFYLSINY